MIDTIRTGDQVLVALEDGKTFLIRLRVGQRHSTHKGQVAHDDVIGRRWGDVLITNTGAQAFLLRPRWIDRMMKVHRRTNIMYPKDAAFLIAALGLQAGAKVVEIGSGSGAMTLALSRAVLPGGMVYSYDLRPEFLEVARANTAAAGIKEGLEFRLREIGSALEPRVDAVFTDVPEPWAELDPIRVALRGSGRFAAAIPTYNQAERLAGALPRHGFAMVETVEVLVRDILARPGKTRPGHRMVGHTQLLTTAVKVVAASDSEPGSTGQSDGGLRRLELSGQGPEESA